MLVRSLRSLGLVVTTSTAVALAVAWAAPASAAVIYNGGAPDQGGQIYAQAPAAVAMSFTLTPGSTVVNGVHWWGGCYPATSCSSAPDFTIFFFTDYTLYPDYTSGTPGGVIASYDVGTANETATGKLIGPPGGSQWNEYAYNATFLPLSLEAGTNYWFGVREISAEPSGGTWGNETTSSAPPSELSASIEISSPTSWTIIPAQFAFQLTDQPVPEPSSLSLFATALLGLLALGFPRRRRHTA
ncbi:MAG: PEP-CTERM sorting domain-containing protein [Rhodospirillales bacterium]|nr:PEP-CTERM sorting domain-containing protein [Rhodospirillales bacterium]